MGIFDKRVSLYRSVKDNTGVEINLRSFLFSTRHKDEVLKIRSIADHDERSRLKGRLPLCTISGLFRPTRSKVNLVQHSGLICLDIDEGDNDHLFSIEQVRPILENRQEVAFVAHSVSGRGYFAIVPIAYPQYHEAHFRALMKEYMRLGINLDKHCSDVTRLRGLTFEESPYINEQALPYRYLDFGEEHRQSPVRKSPSSQGSTERMVASCVRQITDRHINMTQSYDEWILIGTSLASLGESGRSYFHEVSMQYDNYSQSQTDKKFDSLLKRSGSSIGTFFNICRQWGVLAKEK